MSISSYYFTLKQLKDPNKNSLLTLDCPQDMVIIENKRLQIQYIHKEIWTFRISCPIFNVIFIHRKNILIPEIPFLT
jgi:hypothetical protein